MILKKNYQTFYQYMDSRLMGQSNADYFSLSHENFNQRYQHDFNLLN